MSDPPAVPRGLELWDGAGNTFALHDGRRGSAAPDPAAVCDFHQVDGLIALAAPAGARRAAAVRFYNPDGSAAAACGNGLRCAAAFLDPGGARGELHLETAAGVRTARVLAATAEGRTVRVSMGEPTFRPPPRDPRAFAEFLPNGSRTGESGRPGLAAFGPPILVDVGNPHAVFFLEEPATDALVNSLGHALQIHSQFAATGGVNVGFARARSPSRIELRVYERGVGETAACGTGACAAAAAAVAVGRCAGPVGVSMRGGELVVERPPGGELHLTGPAARLRR